MPAVPCCSSTVVMRSVRLACRAGRKLVPEASQTVLTAEARARAVRTDRRVAMEESGTARSAHMTRTT